MQTKDKNSKPSVSRGKQPVPKAAQRRKQVQTVSRDRREETARAAKIQAMKQEAVRKSMPVKRRVQKPRKPMQPVVYTQPKAFNRSRLMIQLITIMAVVMALVMCLSIFFRVETITVSGAKAYSAWAIREASGIQEGDYLLTFSRARASARIIEELPYVEEARIGIKLPNTVNIVIKEIDVVYSIQCSDGIWWLITSGGTVMEQTNAGEAGNYTKILGVTLASPAVGQKAVAYQSGPVGGTEATEEGATQPTNPITVTNQQRLNAALVILQAMELNEVVGEAASVNVSELERIELWYGTRYQVNLGNTERMEEKIAALKATVLELSDYESGALDVSFSNDERVWYTPFE